MIINDKIFSLFLIYLRLKKNNPLVVEILGGGGIRRIIWIVNFMVAWGLELSYIKLQFGPDLNDVQI